MVVLQFPSKEPLKTDAKPPVPHYINSNDADNVNQSSQSIVKKNAHLPNPPKDKTTVHDEQKMNESKSLNDNTFTSRMVDRIENWSPSTAKYARLSVFGCKVSN